MSYWPRYTSGTGLEIPNWNQFPDIFFKNTIMHVEKNNSTFNFFESSKRCQFHSKNKNNFKHVQYIPIFFFSYLQETFQRVVDKFPTTSKTVKLPTVAFWHSPRMCCDIHQKNKYKWSFYTSNKVFIDQKKSQVARLFWHLNLIVGSQGDSGTVYKTHIQ